MTAATPTGEGPEDWCYDALETRTWASRGANLTLLRTLELTWIHFDSNPACFANMVEGEQAIEDFLVGPPAVPTAPEVLDEVRAYIRATRKPGRSTWLALDVAPEHPPVHGLWWRIDGKSPDAGPLPGPSYAGCYGDTPASNRRGIRALVHPGSVEVRVGVSIQTSPPAQQAIELTRTIDIAPHVGLRVRVVFESATSARADLHVTSSVSAPTSRQQW